MIRMERLRRWATINSIAAGLNQRTLTWALVTSAIVLGAFQSLDPAHVIDPDGISYLDMGDALLRGDWFSAVNSLWSPLYAWLQGLAQGLLRPSMYWAFTVVQLVNFVIYLAALAAFHFCLTELLALHRARATQAPLTGARLPEWVWVTLGYTLFLWSALTLTEVTRETPDMLVTACAYLATGLSLRIQRGQSGWLSFALLGAALGLGYMAKAFMFAIALVVIAVSAATVGRWRRALARGALSVAVFLLVGSPLIVALSLKHGRPTFSDQGSITYLMHINQVPFVHWQGEDLGRGVMIGQPLHPTRKIFENPPVFEFGSPVGGTYPPWFDVGYWFEGANPTFDLSAHLRILEVSAGVYLGIFVPGAGSLLAASVALWSMGGRGQTWQSRLEGWVIFLPAVTALGLFATVHVEPRYTPAFVTLLLLGLLCGVRFPATEATRRIVTGLTLGVAAVMLTLAAAHPLSIAFNAARDLARGRDPWPRANYHVAAGLAQLGLQPGDKVAVIGSGFHASGWAWLGRWQIVAELPLNQAPSFWALESAGQAAVMQALADTGAQVAVAEGKPASVQQAAWQRIGNTNHFVFVLTP
jgi:hypothetical protein